MVFAQSAEIVSLAASRSVLWLILVYIAARQRAPLSLLVVALSWAANILVATDHIFASQIVAFPFVGLVVYLLSDRLLHKSTHLRVLIGAKDAEWSKQRHTWAAEDAAYRARIALLEAELRVARGEEEPTPD